MVKRVQSSKQNLETSAPVTWEIEMEEKKDKAKKQRRSSKRVKQPAMKHGLPLLRASSVKPVTLERYQLHHNNFQVWCRESFRRTQTVKELDCSLVDYLQEKYYAGEDLAYANYTLAAVAFFRPGMKGATTLPLTHQCMRGWRNLCPARSRMPLPYEVVTLLAVTAVKKGLTQVGLVLMLNFYLYLRPSEFSRLRVCDGQASEKSRKDISMVGSAIEPKRRRHPIEDTSVGRGFGARPPVSAVLGARHGPSPTAAEQSQRRKGIHCDGHGHQSVPAVRVDSFRPATSGGSSPLPTTSWRSFPRDGKPTSVSQCSAAKGSLASSKISKELREGSRLSQLFGMLDKGVQKRCLQAKKDIKDIFLNQL